MLRAAAKSPELLDVQVFHGSIEEDVDFGALTLHRLPAEIDVKLDTLRNCKLV